MNPSKVYTVIGLMSGTSLDGVDAALIQTDGHSHIRPISFVTASYDPPTRSAIRACLGRRDKNDPTVKAAEAALTRRHIEIVQQVLAKANTGPVDLIGFHGQTIVHDPDNRFTLQIGDAEALAKALSVPVVHDFRSADVAAGGQGAPLIPLYHKALAEAGALETPLAVVNIGGVANVTWISQKDILAFDTGPGNALIDDFILARTGQSFDDSGALAQAGTVDEERLERHLTKARDFLSVTPPKSLDRDVWSADFVQDLSTQNGAATLAAFTAAMIAQGAAHFPAPVKHWLITGGGRHNAFLMQRLRDIVPAPVNTVESVGWNGDALEAQGFAYLAVRSLLGEPLSLPTTTGVPRSMTGGVLVKPQS